MSTTPDRSSQDPSTSDPSTPHPSASDGASSPAPSAAEGAFRAALRDVLIFLAALAVVGAVVGYFAAGMPGVWSALMGAGVVLIFSGTTVVSMLTTANADATKFAGTVAGLWLAKFVVVVAIILVLRPHDFYSKPVFGIIVIIGAIGAIALDMRAVQRARVPYLEPKVPGHGPGDPRA